MTKLIAILNVVAWGGFWAFGFLAFTTHPEEVGTMMTAGALAVLGAGMGLMTFRYLVRHSEATGYARPRNRVPHGEVVDV